MLSEVVINSRSHVTCLQPFAVVTCQGQVCSARPVQGTLGQVSVYFWFAQLQAMGAFGLRRVVPRKVSKCLHCIGNSQQQRILRLKNANRTPPMAEAVLGAVTGHNPVNSFIYSLMNSLCVPVNLGICVSPHVHAHMSTHGSQRMIESLTLLPSASLSSRTLSLNLDLAIWVKLSGQ